MTPAFSVRRRAEEFNTLVEDTSTGSSRDARLTDYLDLVTMMRDVAPPQPTPEFTAALREQLMAAADTLLLPSDDTQRLTLPPRRTARDRRIAALVGGLAIVGASTSLAVASSSALPGEMLYPLKRAIESAENGIHLSDESKGTSLLDNATDRLVEVTALSRTSDLGEGAMIAETLTTFSDQALLASDLLLADYAENGDDASIEELREFTSTSTDTLTQVESLLPDEARDELVHAAEVLGDIDAAAGGACPECSGGIAEIPPVLQSAGQLAERPVVVVPAPLLKEGRPATGGGPQQGGAQGPRQDDAQDDAQDEGQDEGQDDGQDDGDPATDPPIAPNTGAAPGTGTGTGAGPTSPLEVLTDVTTGQGGGQNGGGLPGVPGGGDVVDDVEDSLPDLP